MITFPKLVREFFVFWGLAKPRPVPIPPEPTPLQLATNAWVACQRDLLAAKLVAEEAQGVQDMLVKRETRLRADVSNLSQDQGQVPKKASLLS